MTAEWILIMTLLGGDHAQDTIVTLEGFTAREQCEAAASTWRNQFNHRDANSIYEPARTACVFRGPANTEKVER